MNVILLTIYVSLLLVMIFVVLFLQEKREQTFTSAESDALLPFEEEAVTPAANRRDRTARANR